MASSVPNGDVAAKSETSSLTKQDWAYSRVELYLENIILPADKISPSPSEKDGLDHQSEYDLRYIGCELIQTAGILLKLPQVCYFFVLTFKLKPISDVRSSLEATCFRFFLLEEQSRCSDEQAKVALQASLF